MGKQKIILGKKANHILGKKQIIYLFLRELVWKLLNTKLVCFLPKNGLLFYFPIFILKRDKMVCFLPEKWFAFLSPVFFGFPSLQEIKVVCYLPKNGLLFHIPVIPILIL